MPDNLILHPFRGEDEYTRLAEILTASENADSLPVNVSAADVAERLSTSPRFDIFRDLIIAEMNGQEVGFGRMRCPNFQPELWQVAWEVSSGQVVGSVMTYINHAENKQLGLLRGYTEGISTVPAWQRRGVASALIARSLQAQREVGMTESALVCNGEKRNNYQLYASCGFKEVKRDTVYEKPLILAN